MKLITYRCPNRQSRLGVLVSLAGQEFILDLNDADPHLPADIISFLSQGEEAIERTQRLLAAPPSELLIPFQETALLAPIPRPGKILCLGHNYSDHMGIGRTAPTEYPTIFSKTANTIIGSGQAIVIPPLTQQVDYEAEFAVVIGCQARGVSEAQAMKFVAGYTIFNDVSARDYQKRTSQWMIGKSFDTFGPLGPALVTADEIADPHNLEISLTLNGLEMQRTNTSRMIFSISYLIAYLSAVMTLEVGDIIATGTPAKTELARSIPPFMNAGDEVRIQIEGLGELVNPVTAAAVVI